MRLRVKSGITWHDGEPFTAQDVCFTVSALLDEATPSPVAKPFRAALKGCQVADDGTLVVHFRRAFRQPLEQLQFYVVPRHAFSGTFISPELEFSQRPIGTGPMAGVRGRKDVAFTAYPNAHHRAKIERLDLVDGGDPFVALHALLNGDLHGITSLPRVFEAEVANSSVATLRSTGVSGYVFVALNTHRGALADRRVRQALNLLIDRTALRDVTMADGSVKPAPDFVSGPFLPTSPYANPSVKVAEHGDAAAAEVLLRDAGAEKRDGKWLWNDEPITLKVVSEASIDGWELNRQLRSELTEAGFETQGLDLGGHEWHYLVAGKLQDFDLAIGRWTLRGPDAVQQIFHTRQPDGLGQLNVFDYTDAETDALLARYDAAATDIEARDAYRALHAHLAEDLPYLFLWTVEQRSAWRNEIADVTIGSERYFGTFERWHLTPPP